MIQRFHISLINYKVLCYCFDNLIDRKNVYFDTFRIMECDFVTLHVQTYNIRT